MLAPLLLLAGLILPSAQQPQTVDSKISSLVTYVRQWQEASSAREVSTRSAVNDIVEAAAGVKAQLEELLVDFTELVKIGQVIQNVTSQLLIDLQVLKGRQAVGGAVQGGQVFMFLAYLVTIAVFYLVRHCRKHQEKVARTEFELLETKLQASRSKRRAAAARAGKQSPQ